MSCGLLFFFFLLFLASSCCLVFHASDLPFLCVSSCRVTERAVFLSSRHTGNVAVKNKLSHLFHALQKPQWLNIGVSNDQNKLLKQWCLVFFFFNIIQTTERRANRVSGTRWVILTAKNTRTSATLSGYFWWTHRHRRAYLLRGVTAFMWCVCVACIRTSWLYDLMAAVCIDK